ncbi:hypothetical protein [Thermoproteus tenax]|uniref:hypothetical protein n=1 Tax=Thermoproteus tenax TaxID=2271 RepID=UPI0014332467|nr:hypothetical protein [Thermoproteus tenax]
MIIVIVIMLMRKGKGQVSRPSPVAVKLGLVGEYSEMGRTVVYSPANLWIGALLLGAVGGLSASAGPWCLSLA